MTKTGVYKIHLKSAGDIICAICGLICLFPFLSAIALLVFVSTKKSPFFTQTRIGKNRKTFRIVKFKTMNDKRDEEGNLLPDEERLTKVGNFLRKTSLDELPQLINVIMGDMSLVGPRPWIPEQMAIFSEHKQAWRCRVKPGMTGLAQIYGRNGLTFSQRLTYDILYVSHLSFQMDITILLRTLEIVLKRKGIQQRSDALIIPAKKFPHRTQEQKVSTQPIISLIK